MPSVKTIYRILIGPSSTPSDEVKVQYVGNALHFIHPDGTMLAAIVLTASGKLD